MYPSWLPQRCWPEESQDWHGTILTALWIVVGLLLSEYESKTYEWADVMDGFINAYTSFLLLLALFRQANSKIWDDHDENGANSRIRNYSQIQADRWKQKNFVVVKDEKGTIQKADQPLSYWLIPGQYVKIGPLGLPYMGVSLVTLVLAFAVFEKSYHFEKGDDWVSLTNKLTSLQDWFRTFFLLSFGMFLASMLLYSIPVWIVAWKMLLRISNQMFAKKRAATDAESNPASIELLEKQPQQPEETNPSEIFQPAPQQQQTTVERQNAQSFSPSSNPLSPRRTASDTLWVTKLAMVMTLASMAMTIYFAMQRHGIIMQVQPTLHWYQRRGAGFLDSFQGDAWVLDYALDASASTTDNAENQVWCESPTDFIPVRITVAWGGEWACPDLPESSCQEESVPSRVSCEFATGPLTAVAAEDENDQEKEGADNLFGTVYDYIDFRYQASDDQGNGYDTLEAPYFVLNDDEGNGASLWNRPADFVIANCETCRAMTQTVMEQQVMPDVADALHGLFPSLGACCVSLTWLLLSCATRQRQR